VDARLQVLGVQVEDELLTRRVPAKVSVGSRGDNGLIHGTDIVHGVVNDRIRVTVDADLDH